MYRLLLFTVFLVFLFTLNANAQANLTPERRAQLESELSKIEKELEQNRQILQQKQKETASISRDIEILNYQINQARLNIRAKNLEIQRLGGDINKRESTIVSLSDQIDQEKQSLAELLRKTRELDRASVLDVVLANDNLSGVFADLDSFSFIQQEMHQSFANIRQNQNQAAVEKVSLERRRDAELNARAVIETETRLIESKEKEKQRLLSLSKSEENAYQAVIAERERRRQEIRSALFSLRDTGQIQFGEALDLATQVSKMTGVRPAFLLAIITQESNLGANVGTCNRPGDPATKNWKSIMHPNRDLEPFMAIMKELGRDTEGVPLSCPFGGGYGGAMGPSQFIPSTWVMYKDRVANITGDKPADPWNPKHAFTASGLLLRDLGAASQSYADERRAALRYYAGGNWNNPKNAFYGDSVMRIASQYQQQINTLQSLQN